MFDNPAERSRHIILNDKVESNDVVETINFRFRIIVGFMFNTDAKLRCLFMDQGHFALKQA